MMSEPDELVFNSDSELEEEPLGLKEPLGIIQRFIVPLGARSLTVLDPSIFLHDSIQEDSFSSLVQDSPLFQESAPTVPERVQLGQGQIAHQESAEPPLGETIQRQDSSSENLIAPPGSSLHSPPIAKGEATPTTSSLRQAPFDKLRTQQDTAGQRPSPPPLGSSDPQHPPKGDSHFRGQVPRREKSGGDLEGKHNVFDAFQTASQGGSETAQSASDFPQSSDQSFLLPEKPSTEHQSVENSLNDSESWTIQPQQIEASEIEQPTEIVQRRLPSTDQRTTPYSGQNIPNANVNLQRSSITSSEENQTQSPPSLGDLGCDAIAQPNVIARKELDIAQTSTEKEVDRDNAEIIERSQVSDPTTSPNIDQPIPQQALQPFPEVNPNHSNPIVQAQTYESKVIDTPLDPPIDSPVSLGDPSQNLLETTSSSLDSPRSAPLAVTSNPPILNVAASDRTNAAIESTDFRALITDPTIQQSRSDSTVQWEFSSSESKETTSKEPFVPSESSSSQQKIEVGESTSNAAVMRSPQPPETSDAIAPQVTPHTETNLEATLLQARLIDSASVESESSIVPESPKITSLEIEPPTPLPNDIQADTKGISSQKFAEAKASSNANPNSLLSKTIQFLSKAASSIVTAPKKQPTSETSTQLQSSSVQTDSIQQFEERPSQGLQIQEEPTLSKSPMIAESPFIQSETRSQETLIEQPAQTETRSPDAKTPIQQSTRIETRSAENPIQRSIQTDRRSTELQIQQSVQAENQSPESNFQIQRFVQADERSPEAKAPIQDSVQVKEQTPVTEILIQPSIQLEEQLPEAETPIQSFVQAEGQLPEVEAIEQFVQSEMRSPETPIQRSVKGDEQSSEALFQHSVQAEGRSPEAEEFSEPSIQPETLIQHSVQADDLFPETETSIQRSIQTEEQSREPETPIQQPVQPESRSSDIEMSIQPSVQAEGRSPETFMEPSAQTEIRSPEADPVIQRSVQVKTQSPETETPIQTSVQAEIQSTESPIQHPVEIDARSLEIDSPIQRSIQAEGQTQELEPLNEQSIQVEAGSTETSIQHSVQTDALFSEEATATQQSVQAKTLSSETSIKQSIQSKIRSPKVESSIETPVQAEAGLPEAKTPIPQAVQVEAQSLEVDSEIQRSIQVEARSTETEIPIEPFVQTETQSSEGETFSEQSAEDGTRLPETETSIQRSSAEAETRSPEAETPFQRFIQPDIRTPEVTTQQSVQAEDLLSETEAPFQHSARPETQSSETSIEQFVQPETQSPETPIQSSVETETQSPEVDTLIESSAQTESVLETDPIIQRSVQSEARPSKTFVERSAQAEGRSPEVEMIIQRSVQAKTRSLDTEIPIQTEIQSTETPIQRPVEIDVRSLEIDSPIQRSIQAEGQTQELEPLNEQSLQVEAGSTETSIQHSVQTDALFSEGATSTQQSAQAEMLSLETPIEQSIQPETGLSESETSIPQPVQFETQSLEVDSEIQRSIQPGTRSSETSIQPSVQPEGGSYEAESSLEAFVQPETRLSETFIKSFIQTEGRSPEAEALIEPSVQAETRPTEIDTPIEPSVRAETRSPEIPVQPLVQAKEQTPVTETPIQPFAEAETRSPETETPIQRFIQPDIRLPEVTTQQAVQAEDLRSETETPFQRSAQSEMQSSETSIEQLVQPEMREPETAIQREGRSAELPIQPSIQSKTQLPEAEPSIQKMVQIEGRSPTADASIQRFTQPSIHEKIQPPQLPSQLSQPENEGSSELVTSEAEMVQPISPSELAIAREIASESLSETAISPYSEGQPGDYAPNITSSQCPVEEANSSLHSPPQSPILGDFEQLETQVQRSDRVKVQNEEQLGTSRILKTPQTDSNDFPQLPNVLQNLSILKPLVQTTAQKISEQSYSSSYSSPLPLTHKRKQTQSPPILGDLGFDVSSAERGECSKFSTSQTSVQEPIATDSTITVQKSPTQYTKIDIPPRKSKTAEVRSHLPIPSPLIAPKITLQPKRQIRSDVIQMVRNQTLIPQGKEEIPLKTDTSTSDIAQDLETLAQMIYAQLQQRLRIDRERRGSGTERFPW
jgi:hypothetical protein